VSRDEKKADLLKAAFPELREVIVADIPRNNDGTLIRTEFVSFLAATQVLNNLARQQIIGIGSGYTMYRFAELSIPDIESFKNTKWVPIMAYITDNDANIFSANYIALRMLHRHPGSEALYLPYINDSSSAENKDAAEAVTRAASEANSVFFTVNGPNRKSREDRIDVLNQFRAADGTEFGYLRSIYDDLVKIGREDELIGEVLGMMLNSNAELAGTNEIKEKNRELVFQIDLDILRRAAHSKRSYIVAARLYKAPVILMAIRNRLANSLVIDSEIAQYLLDHV